MPPDALVSWLIGIEMTYFESRVSYVLSTMAGNGKEFSTTKSLQIKIYNYSIPGCGFIYLTR